MGNSVKRITEEKVIKNENSQPVELFYDNCVRFIYTMTISGFFGCALTAYSPPLALFIVTIAKDPVRVIILILSAFFWLLSLLISSIIWFAAVPLREKLAFGLVFSIIFQEIFRFLIYLLLSKADAYLRKLTENESTRIFANRHILSYVVGLGFGMMSGAFSLVNVLADSIGPGTVGFNGEPQDFFMVSALQGMAMILLQTFWGVIAFDALDRKKWMNLVYVWSTHLLVSCLTLLNEQQLYWASIIPMYIVLVVTTFLAFKVAGGQFSKVVSCLKCSKFPQTVQVPAPEN